MRVSSITLTNKFQLQIFVLFNKRSSTENIVQARLEGGHDVYGRVSRCLRKYREKFAGEPLGTRMNGVFQNHWNL